MAELEESVLPVKTVLVKVCWLVIETVLVKVCWSVIETKAITDV